MGGHVYILRCHDGSYYVGSTSEHDLTIRISQHQSGTFPGSYAYSRRPVKLAWSEHFEAMNEAISAERRLKGWSRAKKEALIKGDWTSLQGLAKRRAGKPKIFSARSKPDPSP
jgi:putative endonuclease